MAPSLDVFAPGALWLREYLVRVGGARFNARMTVVKLRGGEILLHSPCAFCVPVAAEVAALGPVAAIIAPGNFHWLHVRAWQQAFPDAVTYVCPGVEERANGLTFDLLLGDEAPQLWADELSQVAVHGTRVMREVAFFHRASRTLVLVDLVENFTSATPGTNLFFRVLFRGLGMWNRPSPAPEYRFAWGDKARVRRCMERILAWDFDRAIPSLTATSSPATPSKSSLRRGEWSFVEETRAAHSSGEGRMPRPGIEALSGQCRPNVGATAVRSPCSTGRASRATWLDRRRRIGRRHSCHMLSCATSRSWPGRPRYRRRSRVGRGGRCL